MFLHCVIPQIPCSHLAAHVRVHDFRVGNYGNIGIAGMTMVGIGEPRELESIIVSVS